MELSLLSDVILLLFIPFIIILLGTVFFYIYKYLTNAHKDIKRNKDFNKYFEDLKKDLFFKEQGSSLLNIILIIYLILAVFLTYLVSGLYGYGFITYNFDIILILLCFLVPLLLSGINYSSQELYSSSKDYYKTLFGNIIPILLSILSLFIILIGIESSTSDMSIAELINFQNQNTFRFFGIPLNAYFMLLNPFAALAFITGIMGLFRTFNSKSYTNNKLNQKIFTKIYRNTLFLSVGLLFILLFLGGVSLTGVKYLDFAINLSICLGIILLIAIIDNGRPKLFVERDLWNYITVPMFFAILAIGYSCFIILFNLGIVVIQ